MAKKPKKVPPPWSEPLSNASPTREACNTCLLHKTCKHPFMKPYVPPGWETGRRILMLGEAPGEDEDERTGRQFTGRAGQLLRRMWTKAGYHELDFALANAVRCRPRKNRTPSMREMRACRAFVVRAIEALRPNLVVGLGTIAAKSLTNTGSASVTALRGRPVVVPGCDGVVAFVTYHPAAILHGATHLKRRIISDLRRFRTSTVLPFPEEASPIGKVIGLDTEFGKGGLYTIGIADKERAIAYDVADHIGNGGTE